MCDNTHSSHKSPKNTGTFPDRAMLLSKVCPRSVCSISCAARSEPTSTQSPLTDLTWCKVESSTYIVHFLVFVYAYVPVAHTWIRCICMSRSEEDVKCLLCCFPVWFWRQEPSLKLELIHQPNWLAKEPLEDLYSPYIWLCSSFL